MSRRIFCKILLVAVAVLGLFVLSGVLLAQGRSADAFERVKAVQERNSERLIAMQDVEGTAIGRDQNGQLVVKVFTARRGVAGIPKTLDGVPVQVVVSGKIYALKPPARPPKAPRALTATAVGENRIDLDWRDNRESGVAYNVYRATTSGGYNPENPIAEGLASSDHSDTTVAAGTTYYYVVTAENANGESGYSNEASATTEGGVVEPPAAPSDLTATAISSSQIDLGWTDHADNETGFSIECIVEGSFTEIATVGADVTSYSDTGLASSTTYTYRVCAYNSAGDSDYDGPVLATTNPAATVPPAPPSGLTATVVSSTEIDLDWGDNPPEDLVDYYNVYRSETSGGGYGWIGDTEVSNYSDTGLTPETPYYYVVTAMNTAGESADSGEAAAETDPEPETPIDPRDRFDRPVPIGVSTGHPDITAGTIGCRVVDGSGNLYALSNNHVYANGNNASIGDNVLQPGTADGGALPGDYLGTLADFEPIDFGWWGYNTIDAAIAECEGTLDNTTPVGEGGGYGTPSSTTVTAEPGLAVQKYGRTTGLTTGVVTSVNGAFLVRYSRGFAVFYEQIVIEVPDFSAGGDSGSLIVTQAGNNPVALLFAGSDTLTIANPIDAVLDRFEVDVDDE
ncbi:MAG: fibronectin type III domain-containing protein [Planctomycetota bacterium]|jgi:fibronectin type 3 domain-containing protein